MSRDMVKKLKELRQKDINPNAEWVKSNREILLSQIKNTGASQVQKSFGERFWSGMSIFVPQKIVFNVVKPLAILLVVAIVGSSGWITAVDAAYEALPGDLLYTAKRIMEKTQVATAGILKDENAETKLHAEFAKRRASEIKKVVKSNVEDKEGKLAKTLVDLKKEIDNVNTSLEKVKIEKVDAEETVKTIKEVQKNTEKIKDDLKQAKDDLIVENTELSQGLSDDILEAKKLNKEIEIKVVEVVVSKHMEEGSEISKETVAEVVGVALKSSLNELKTAQGEAEAVNGIMEGVRAVSSSTLSINSSTTSLEITSSTEAIDQEAVKLDTVSNQVKQAVEKTTTANQEADKKAEEVKEILETGSITEIVEKVKQVAEIVKETDQTSSDALKAANTVVVVKVTEVTNESLLNSGVINIASSTASSTTVVSTSTKESE